MKYNYWKKSRQLLFAGLLGTALFMNACGSMSKPASSSSEVTAVPEITEIVASGSSSAGSSDLSGTSSDASTVSSPEQETAASTSSASVSSSSASVSGSSSSVSGSSAVSEAAADTASSSVESISITDASPEETEAGDAQSYQPSPAWVTALPSAQDDAVKQLFIVAGTSMDSATASVSMHFRDADGSWKQILDTSGIIGRDGMCADADHIEGSDFTRTPIGIYHFNRALGIADDPGCHLGYVKVDDNSYWSGDEREGMAYNQLININDYPDLDLESSVHFVDAVPEYQYCLNISFNEEGTPGRGSAIFLRCAGEAESTGGSVAIPEESMKTVMEMVDPDCVVIIDTLENLNPEGAAAAETSAESAETAESAPAETAATSAENPGAPAETPQAADTPAETPEAADAPAETQEIPAETPADTEEIAAG